MSRRLIFILIFLLSFTLINTLFSGKKTEREQLKTGDIALITSAASYQKGQDIDIIIQNNTENSFEIPSPCPLPALDIYYYEKTNWVQVIPDTKIDCTNVAKNIPLVPKTETKLSLKSWKYDLFEKTGRYQARIKTQLNGEQKEFISNEFVIEKQSFFRLIWQELLYRPIYNTLILMATKFSGHNLGLAIILLTIIIRTVLLYPSQKALRSQKRLQEIQPKLEVIKKKYKDNQERIAQETIKLWKEHKVNPLGSCLPLLIQFPILIALFYVIRDGLEPSTVHLLYSPLKEVALTNINVNFLSLDLTKINLIVLPLIVGGLQFLQIKLQLNKNKASQKEQTTPPEMRMVNQTMLYFMPVMIALFTASVPAGVGLYWAASTLYGIFQQLIVNAEFK